MKEIKPPKFDGNLSKFLQWKNLFENLVHNNDELLNVQKFWYLKKAMVKDIENLLDDFDMSDEAYTDAWSYLLSRFEKKRSIILALFHKLIHIEQLKDEKGIQQLIDRINGTIRGLKAAGEKVEDTFSKFVVFIAETH